MKGERKIPIHNIKDFKKLIEIKKKNMSKNMVFHYKIKFIVHFIQIKNFIFFMYYYLLFFY